MQSDQCRAMQCPYFGKFSGKAVCRYEKLTTGNAPKRFVKHLAECPNSKK